MSSQRDRLTDGIRRLPTRLLTVDEAAAFLAVGRSRMYELLAAGAVRSVQIGRSRRIPLGDLENYVESLRSLSSDRPG